jgi:hypothetical protein
MRTKLGKNEQIWEGERAEIRPQNGPKKITAHRCFVPKLVEIGAAVSEKKLKMFKC